MRRGAVGVAWREAAADAAGLADPWHFEAETRYSASAVVRRWTSGGSCP